MRALLCVPFVRLWLAVMAFGICLTGNVSFLFAQEPLAYGELVFQGGKSSFADVLEWYDPLYSGGPAPENGYPQNTLGPANGFYAALGRGGAVQVRFADNLLTNSGDTFPDLFFAESIGTPEDAFFYLRPTPETAHLLPSTLDPDNDGFFSIGEYVASKNLSPGRLGSIYGLIDLDSVFPGFAAGTLRFDGVRVIDNPDLGAQAGMTVGMDLESIGAFSSILVPSTLGDFNFDGQLNDDDLYYMRTPGLEWLFDLTGDGLATIDDRDAWVRDIMKSGPGDANLDGEFNSADLVQVFVAGEYEDGVIANSRWSTGDWNYSNDFTSRDLTLAMQAGRYEQGPIITPTAVVPEPSCVTLGAVVLAILGARRKL